MPDNDGLRSRSLVFPTILILVGGIFLYRNWHPEFDPWPILRTYWPLILVFVGLGKMWDAARSRQAGTGDTRAGVSLGATFGALAFVLVLIALFWHGRAFSHNRNRDGFVQHFAKSVETQGAKSVDVSLEVGAGELNINSGASHLLDADFRYSDSYETPRVQYNVTGGVGHLRVAQDDTGSVHFGTRHNNWDLRFSDEVPLQLKVELGAGRGHLKLRDLEVTRLDMSMGAGQVDLDLTGDRKKDLTGDLEGGVGQATIRLPRNVGVIVNASGGIGSITARDLHRNGDEYTNEAYGKTPATIRLKVEGGVGQISLIQE